MANEISSMARFYTANRLCIYFISELLKTKAKAKKRKKKKKSKHKVEQSFYVIFKVLIIYWVVLCRKQNRAKRKQNKTFADPPWSASWGFQGQCQGPQKQGRRPAPVNISQCSACFTIASVSLVKALTKLPNRDPEKYGQLSYYGNILAQVGIAS